ncbi:MAG: hypothetical protein KatS3mg109_0498 [Pirellulaceae bacterium]|nr:MAG: hypothetical protein KatS3mg109_0498 [Pirellulaceae bacterium]
MSTHPQNTPDWDALVEACLDDSHPQHRQAYASVLKRVLQFAARALRRYGRPCPPQFIACVLVDCLGTQSCSANPPQDASLETVHNGSGGKISDADGNSLSNDAPVAPPRISCQKAYGYLSEVVSIFFSGRLQQYKIGRGSFPAWANKVVGRIVVDILRQQTKWYTDGFPGAPEDTEQGRRDEPEAPPDPETVEPFAEEDLKQCETVPILRRVIAMAILGFYRRVPAARWKKWLDEVRQVCPDIPDPFPPAAVDNPVKLKDRARIIHQVTGLSVDALIQHVNRAREQLRFLFDKYYGNS